MTRILLIALCLFTSMESFGVPVTLNSNLRVRTQEGNKAVNSGNYVLMANSVVDLPDQYIVRNSIGEIDLTASFQNWLHGDGTATRLDMVDSRNRKKGNEAFFKLKILKAAPGSRLPPDGVEPIGALSYLAKRRLLSISKKDQMAAGDLEPQGKPADVPVPTPRPPNYANVPVPTPRPSNSNSSSIDTSGTGSGFGKPTPNIPVPTPRPQRPSDKPAEVPAPTKEQVLNADTPKMTDVKVYEKADVPVPTPRPQMTDAEKAAVDAVQVAADKLKKAGTTDQPCRNGVCPDSPGGNEETPLVCEEMKKGDFPDSLNKITLTKSGQKTIDAVVQWISRALSSPSYCKQSCNFDTSKGLLSGDFKGHTELKNYCSKTKDCHNECKFSKIIRDLSDYKCRASSNKLRNNCKKECNPYGSLNFERRADHLKRMYKQVGDDMAKAHPEFASRMKANELFDDMPMRLLCLNLRRENYNLDPLARDCNGDGATGFGMGQVQYKTFFSTFGFVNETHRSKCAKIKIKDLSPKTCRGMQPQFFREGVYEKYKNLTPNEIYDMRSLDMEVQARINYSVFMNKLVEGRFSKSRAWRSYFGKKDNNAIKRIDRCMRTGK